MVNDVFLIISDLQKKKKTKKDTRRQSQVTKIQEKKKTENINSLAVGCDIEIIICSLKNEYSISRDYTWQDGESQNKIKTYKEELSENSFKGKTY